jgi:hypothetical protein
VTDPVDPPRLDVSNDAPELAQRALRVARADIPSAAKLASAQAALFARLGLPPPTGGGGGNTSGGEPSGSPSPNPAAQVTPTAVTSAGVVGAVAVSLAVVMTFAVSRSEPPMADNSLPPSFPSATASSTASVVVPASASVPTVSLDDLPKASAQVAPTVVPRSSTPVAEDESLEVDLVSRAQKALKSTPAEALRLCDEHARRFPRGSLSQERESLGIEALSLLGRRDEAVSRAARFKQAYPASGHLRKLEALGVLP